VRSSCLFIGKTCMYHVHVGHGLITKCPAAFRIGRRFSVRNFGPCWISRVSGMAGSAFHPSYDVV
jgi:hypothetical protein